MRRGGTLRRTAEALGRAVLYAALLAIFVFPLWSVITTALSGISVRPGELVPTPRQFTLENYATAWSTFKVSRYFANSVIVVVFAVALQMAVSTLAAYALARKRFVGSAVVTLLILSTMMMPEEVIAIPLYLVLNDLPLLNVNLLNTYVGMILPLAGWAFAIFVLTEFMKGIPLEIEESARIDGAGELTIFWRIVLPMVKPALGTVLVFSFIMVWDQYLLPLIVASDTEMFTLPIALINIRREDTINVPTFMAAASMAMVPSILVFLLLQRFFVRGLASGSVKG